MTRLIAIKTIVCPKCGNKPIPVVENSYSVLCPACSTRISTRSK